MELRDVKVFESKYINDFIINLEVILIYDLDINFFIFYEIQKDDD